MALKIYKSLIGWDNLDDFYERKVEGVYFLSEDGFTRTFCRCGEVFNEDKSGCSCGHSNFEKIIMSNRRFLNPIEHRVLKKIEKKEFKLILKTLTLDNSTRENAKFESNEKEILMIDKGNLISYDKSSLEYVKEEHMKDYYDYEDLKSPLFFVSSGYASFGVKILKAFQLKKYYPTLQADQTIWQYKYLARKIIGQFNLEDCSSVSYIDFKTLLEDKEIYKEEYYDIIDYYAENDNGWRNSFQLYKGEITSRYEEKKETVTEFLNTFDRIYLYDKTSVLFVLRHYLKTKMIGLHNFERIYKQMAAVSSKVSKLNSDYWSYAFYGNPSKLDNFDCDWIKYFIPYIKDRIELLNDSNIFEKFIEDTLFLKDKGIPINEEVLKQKNFNYMLNTLYLKDDLNLSEEKIDLFFEVFDTNPVMSLEILKDRRNLTKKQKEEFLDILSKM